MISINRSDRSNTRKINYSSIPSVDCLNISNNHFSSHNPFFQLAFPFRATPFLLILLSVLLIISFQHQAKAASLSIPVSQMIGESGLFERDDRDYRPLQVSLIKNQIRVFICSLLRTYFYEKNIRKILKNSVWKTRLSTIAIW